MTIQAFIKKRPYLVWHTKNYTRLSEEAVVEATLNYGDFDDVKQLIEILGIKKVAAIFRRHTSSRKMRTNYPPKLQHYFHLYFHAHA